jgi:hypothetical protein
MIGIMKGGFARGASLTKLIKEAGQTIFNLAGRMVRPGFGWLKFMLPLAPAPEVSPYAVRRDLVKWP